MLSEKLVRLEELLRCGENSAALKICQELRNEVAERDRKDSALEDQASSPLKNQVMIQTFLRTEQEALLAQAYQGFLSYGLGAVFIGWQWLSGVETVDFEFRARSDYLDQQTICSQVPEPQLQKLKDLFNYDPKSQAIVVFYGNDLSSERNKFDPSLGFFVVSLIKEANGIEAFERLGLRRSPNLIQIPRFF